MPTFGGAPDGGRLEVRGPEGPRARPSPGERGCQHGRWDLCSFGPGLRGSPTWFLLVKGLPASDGVPAHDSRRPT